MLRFFLLFFLTPLSLFAQDLLKTKDIHEVMQQILSQHLGKKSVSSSLLQNAYQVYIDQFDPQRIYLLEEEVRPYTQMTPAEIESLVQAYQQNDVSGFIRLNEVFQKAIERARAYRKELKQSPDTLFTQAQSRNSQQIEWQTYAQTTTELKKRIKDKVVDAIRAEGGQSGVQGIKLLSSIENQMQQFEDLYLTNENGKLSTSPEKENLFVLHVLKALANSLDAHTKVLNATEAYEMKIRLEKEYQGIGIKLGKKGESIIITGLMKNGPAAVSKQIFVNDRLIEVNGIAVTQNSLQSVLEVLRGGSESSTVNLVLKRIVKEDNNKSVEKTVDVQLHRATIPVDIGRAEYAYEKFGQGILGKITLNTFYQSSNGVSSENDVRKAIEQLKEQGPLLGLILDLRRNAGGFLTQAVKVAGLFVTSGVIVISKYSSGNENIYRDVDGKTAYNGPLIILTSKETASAAEIVAQALQDYGLAVIVGDEHTYGKGTIQSQTVTGNGNSPSFFKVTVGTYYTVSGNTPQLRGVRADVVVPSVIFDEQIGEEYFDQPMTPDTVPSAYADSLTDVKPQLKPWYLRYYFPKLQQKNTSWQSILPSLRKNSADRIVHNKEYQMQLKQGIYNFSANDPQMEEAENILKDMIMLQGGR